MSDVALISGYELLPFCPKETDEAKRYAQFRNKVGPDGYDSSVLFGADTGLRSWVLNYETLSDGLGDKTYTVDGVTMTPAEYIWHLYERQMVTGQPFVIQGYIGGQKYLTKFEDEALSYHQTHRKLYSTGLKLEQVRVSGVTVFDPSLMRISRFYDPERSVSGVAGDLLWGDQSGNGESLYVGSGTDVSKILDVQNGLPVIRLNASGSTTCLRNDTGLPVREVFIVFKMREAAFSNNAGIISNQGSPAFSVLSGASGTTKFIDNNFEDSLVSYYFAKNGVQFAENNQQAPMNAFGLVHIRANDEFGIPQDMLQFGKKEATAGTFAKVDYGDIILSDTLNPWNVSLECCQHLITRWGIGD